MATRKPGKCFQRRADRIAALPRRNTLGPSFQVPIGGISMRDPESDHGADRRLLTFASGRIALGSSSAVAFDIFTDVPAGETSMRLLLAVIGALAVIVAIVAAGFFFGGFYNVAASEEDPQIVT